MDFRRRLLAALACCLAAALPASATTRVPAPAATPAVTTVPAVPRPASPRLALETSMGRIVLELYPQQAPATVANFLAYARAGHYNGTVFHRTIAGVLIQGGGFTPDLQPKPELAPVVNEAGNGLRNTRGTLGAARRAAVADSAGAQFYLNLRENHGFDRRAATPPEAAGFTVFGRVIDGLDVADRIAALPTTARAPFGPDVPVAPVVIERVELLPPAPAAAPAAPVPGTPVSAAPDARPREPTHP
jgi:cyclophilin family peptidyl-prolyl cis-trans isomerase